MAKKTERGVHGDASFPLVASSATSGKIVLNRDSWEREFRLELRKQIPPVTLVSYLRAGLDALDIKFFQHEGEVTDQVDLIAWSERRQYAELIAKLSGLLSNKVELSGPDGGPVPMAMVLKNLSDEELQFLRSVVAKAKKTHEEVAAV